MIHDKIGFYMNTKAVEKDIVIRWYYDDDITVLEFQNWPFLGIIFLITYSFINLALSALLKVKHD